MRKGESELGQIEFETTDGPSVAAPDVALGAASSAKLPALMVALVVGGLLAALIWFSSGSDSSAAPDETVADEPVGEQPEDGENAASEVEPEEQEAEVEHESVIPESSRASIALEPLMLPSGLFGALTIDGQLLSVVDGVSDGGPLLAPPISRSVDDGESWEELETRAFVDGSENTVGYFWGLIEQAGDVLVLRAFVPESGESLSFTSTDGIEWQDFATIDDGEDTSFFSQPIAITESYSVVLSAFGSDGLAQLLEDHTTAIDVGEVCFAEFRTVFGCDGITEWRVAEEMIDSEFDSDAVFACLDFLAPRGADIRLSRVGGIDFGQEVFNLRVSVLVALPLLLPDGRVVGVESNFANDQTVCDGLAQVDPVDPQAVYVFDPVGSTVERAELEPSLDSFSTEVLGHVPSSGPEDLFLFRFGDQIWSLDLSTGEWATLGANLPGDAILSESGRRVYTFDGRDLHILDLELVGSEIITTESVVFVPLPDFAQFSGSSSLSSATDEAVVFETERSVWLLDIPDGLRCAEQFAEALEGNGLVGDC